MDPKRYKKGSIISANEAGWAPIQLGQKGVKRVPLSWIDVLALLLSGGGRARAAVSPLWCEKFSVYWRGLRVWSLAQASCGINIHIYTYCLLPWTTQLVDGQWLQGYRFKNL